MASAIRSAIGTNSALQPNDTVIADEEKIKTLKKNVNHLYKQLKNYSESHRKFLSARKTFFLALKELYEDNWDGRNDFQTYAEQLEKIGEAGAEAFDSKAVHLVVEYKDEFNTPLTNIKGYKEKAKQHSDARKKVDAYMKKKNPNEDDLRKLKSAESERLLLLTILQKKLRDELPKFYNQRMEKYSSLWKEVFENQLSVCSLEQEAFSNLLACVRQFNQKRLEGVYDAIDFDMGHAEDDYAFGDDVSDWGSTTGDKPSMSRASSESSCYAVVHKSSNQSDIVRSEQSRPPPPVPHKPQFGHNSTLGLGD